MDLFKPNVQKLRERKDAGGLIKALGNKDPGVRAEACLALGGLGDKSAVEPLTALLKDKDEHVRRNAAHALGWLGDPRAAGELLAALADKSIFPIAVGALAKLKEPRLFDVLMRAFDDDTLGSTVASALGELGDPRAVEPLMQLLKRPDVQTRRDALSALARLRDARAAGAVREMLVDEDGTVRRFAIYVLEQLSCPLENDALVRFLHDPDVEVRESAASRMQAPKDPAEQAWYAAARGDWDIVAKLGPSAAEPLFLATQTDNERKRVGAATALAKLGDRRAVEPLISCLQQVLARPEIYSQAAKALGKYGDLRAVKPLQGFLDSMFYEPAVRGEASSALFQLETRLRRISSQPPVCSNCGEAIAALKRTIADDLSASGVIAIGAGLDQKLYEGVICRSCGRILCLKCHNPGEKGHSCPVCGHDLSPLFADYLMG
jgi:HEAT repeat protein